MERGNKLQKEIQTTQLERELNFFEVQQPLNVVVDSQPNSKTHSYIEVLVTGDFL